MPRDVTTVSPRLGRRSVKPHVTLTSSPLGAIDAQLPAHSSDPVTTQLQQQHQEELYDQHHASPRLLLFQQTEAVAVPSNASSASSLVLSSRASRKAQGASSALHATLRPITPPVVAPSNALAKQDPHHVKFIAWQISEAERRRVGRSYESSVNREPTKEELEEAARDERRRQMLSKLPFVPQQNLEAMERHFATDLWRHVDMSKKRLVLCRSGRKVAETNETLPYAAPTFGDRLEGRSPSPRALSTAVPTDSSRPSSRRPPTSGHTSAEDDRTFITSASNKGHRMNATHEVPMQPAAVGTPTMSTRGTVGMTLPHPTITSGEPGALDGLAAGEGPLHSPRPGSRRQSTYERCAARFEVPDPWSVVIPHYEVQDMVQLAFRADCPIEPRRYRPTDVDRITEYKQLFQLIASTDDDFYRMIRYRLQNVSERASSAHSTVKTAAWEPSKGEDGEYQHIVFQRVMQLEARSFYLHGSTEVDRWCQDRQKVCEMKAAVLGSESNLQSLAQARPPPSPPAMMRGTTTRTQHHASRHQQGAAPLPPSGTQLLRSFSRGSEFGDVSVSSLGGVSETRSPRANHPSKPPTTKIGARADPRSPRGVIGDAPSSHAAPQQSSGGGHTIDEILRGLQKSIATSLRTSLVAERSRIQSSFYRRFAEVMGAHFTPPISAAASSMLQDLEKICNAGQAITHLTIRQWILDIPADALFMSDVISISFSLCAGLVLPPSIWLDVLRERMHFAVSSRAIVPLPNDGGDFKWILHIRPEEFGPICVRWVCSKEFHAMMNAAPQASALAGPTASPSHLQVSAEDQNQAVRDAVVQHVSKIPSVLLLRALAPIIEAAVTTAAAVSSVAVPAFSPRGANSLAPESSMRRLAAMPSSLSATVTQPVSGVEDPSTGAPNGAQPTTPESTTNQATNRGILAALGAAAGSTMIIGGERETAIVPDMTAGPAPAVAKMTTAAASTLSVSLATAALSPNTTSRSKPVVSSDFTSIRLTKRQVAALPFPSVIIDILQGLREPPAATRQQC